MRSAAREFTRRLGEYHNGQLVALQVADGRVVAEWTLTGDCDWLQPDVVDLAISLKRGYSGSIESIDAKRVCNGEVREFTISGSRYRQYVSGKISDSQFVQGL